MAVAEATRRKVGKFSRAARRFSGRSPLVIAPWDQLALLPDLIYYCWVVSGAELSKSRLVFAMLRVRDARVRVRDARAGIGSLEAWRGPATLSYGYTAPQVSKTF